MEVTYDEHEIALWVDDQPTHPAAATLHFQKDPFPGGATFRLLMRGAELQQDFAFLRHDDIAGAHSTANIARFLMKWNNWVGHARRTANPIAVRWVLNRFETVHVSPDAIVLEGICSPIVHSP